MIRIIALGNTNIIGETGGLDPSKGEDGLTSLQLHVQKGGNGQVFCVFRNSDPVRYKAYEIFLSPNQASKTWGVLNPGRQLMAPYQGACISNWARLDPG
jgi:hypothetical protein